MADHGFTHTFGWTGPGGSLRRHHQRVTEAVPVRKPSWLVVDNYFNFTEDETVSA